MTTPTYAAVEAELLNTLTDDADAHAEQSLYDILNDLGVCIPGDTGLKRAALNDQLVDALIAWRDGTP